MAITYRQALEYISNLDDPYLAALRDRGKPTWGLDSIRALLGRLGDPHLAYPTIHIAGTKGKGSTAAFIAQILIESGVKTGLYTSPHLQYWRERIQINRKLIPETDLADLVEDFQPHAEHVPGITAFEAATALAFWYFAREGCSAAVIEVGLGGRLDATSVVEPIVAVITNISIDHTLLLGDTLEQIAKEKAAIIKPGVPVVSAPQAPEVQDVIERRAKEMDSPLTLVGHDWHTQIVSLTWDGSEAVIGNGIHSERYTIGLAGAFQVENAASALAASHEAECAGLPITQEGRQAGLANIRWPGRLEFLSHKPAVVIDSAHNVHSMYRLVEALEALLPNRNITVVFGCMSDKDIGGMLRTLLPISRRIILTQADHSRAAQPQDLLIHASSIIQDSEQEGTGWGEKIPVITTPTITEAVHLALDSTKDNEAICITGSLAVVGEARTILADRAVSPHITSPHARIKSA